MNYVLDDLWKLSKDYSYTGLWDKINTKYYPLFKQMSSRFKELCPKDLTETNRRINLMSILERHNVYSNELLNDLINEH